MKEKITKVFFYLIALLPLLGAKQLLYAQGFNLTDRVFLGSDSGEIYMITKSVYADTDLYISGGVSLVQKEIGDPITYKALISGYNNAGNKLFQHHIDMEDCERTHTSGYKAIEKIEQGKYVIVCGGIDLDKTPQRGGLAEPFIYFFNAEGEKISSFILEDTIINREIQTISVNESMEILMVGGQASPNGFVITDDWGPNFITDSTYFWLCKLNSNGQLLWHKSYPNLRSEQWGTIVTKLLVSPDQTKYTIAGTLNYGYPYLLQTDSAGNELWHKPLQLRESYINHPNVQYLLTECSIDIAAAPGGGYYFISSTPYTSVVDTLVDDQLAFYYGKLNEQGDTLWTKQYQPYTEYNTNKGRQIQVAANGDLIMTGNIGKNVWPSGYKEDRTCVFRTDSLGNVKWYREPMNYNTQQNGISTSHLLYSLSLMPGRDGILAGGSYIGHYDPFLATQPNDGNTFSWLILMDSLGHRCAEDTVMLDAISPCDNVTFPGPTAIYQPDANTGRLILYPNPAQDKVYIKTEGDIGNEKELLFNICDMQGRVIINRTLQMNEQHIDIAGLTAGIYLVTVKSSKGKLISRQKLVKE